jgi:tetraacyldisaccharide 4'-kinase
MANPLLQPLSAGFRIGVALRHAAYRRGWFKTRRLNRPVVSVGNLTVGGTGKTPLVEWLAKTLLKRGWRPGILTRGYGRRGWSNLLALEPQPHRVVDARETGDEPAVLAKALPEVPIVVCADRYRAGLLAEDRFGVNVHLLDDGFQHLALARDVDVVLLDTTRELSDRALLPAGPQREPSSALERAHLVVLTRVDLADPVPLENQVRRINPRATTFRSTTKLCGLVEVEGGSVCSLEALRGKPVSAFCGIGNPQAFFADLRRWGFTVVAQEVFPDHHLYTEEDLTRLDEKARAAGVAALLTTEKDAVNLPPLWESETPLLACGIETQMLEPGDFEEALLSQLEAARKAG